MKAFLEREYGILAESIVAAPRGYYGETWKVLAAASAYFVKIDNTAHKNIYARSFALVEHLNQHGIDFISRIVKTRDADLYTHFGGAVFGVFDWIGGAGVENDATKFHEYDMLARIYAVPANGIVLPKAEFTGAGADTFFAAWQNLDAESEVARVLEQHREVLEHRANRLKLFARRCAADNSRFYITHGDAGGNILVDGGKFFLVDWDDAVFAPPERDAWVMGCRQWAREMFNDALKRNNVDYELRGDRLAFYCYHMFFFYIMTFLDGFAEAGAAREIHDYFGGWIEERMQWADEQE